MADGKEPPFYDDHSPGPFQYKLPFYETMELFIETLTGTCFELRVSPFEAVLSVKAKIQRLEGITVAQQHLIWNNLELDDDYCLHDYGIAEGCTLKLVLAMRGGPINTRRVTVEDPMKEGPELTEGRWQQGWIGRAGAGGGAGGGGHRQVTFLLYREGDQLNFLRVVDRGDGTLTPLSEPLSAGSPLCHMCGDGEADRECRGAAQHSAENSITMSKMRLLKAKMEGMNLNKKLAKLKPRPSACPLPGPGSQGPPGAPHHHRLLPQLRPSPSANAPSSSSLLHLSPLARRAPTPFSSSSSCFMLEEEEAPWGDSGPPPPRISKPPKVSRLDVGGGGGSRLVRDCVYPRLHPLSRTLHPPEAAPEGPRSAGQRAPAPGDLPDPLRPGALFGALPEPLRALDVSGEARRGAAAAAAAGGGALHSLALPASPPLLSTWATGPGPSVPLPSAAASSPAVLLDRPLPQPFEFTGSPSCSSPSSSPSPTHNHPQARHAAALEPGRAPPPRPPYSVAPPPRPPYSVAPPPRPLRLRVFKVDAQGKKETRGVARLAGLACKEPPGTLSNSQLLASLAASRASAGRGEAAGPCPGSRRPSGFPPDVGRASLGSRPPATATAAGLRLFKDDLLRQMSPAHTASTSLGPGEGASTSVRRLGTPTCHLPPLKAPIGSKKKNTKHCFLCGKKTGLASSYDCRCGKNFCATHRYAEAHPCSYDYKGAGRRLLQDTHPIVSAPKLPKI